MTERDVQAEIIKKIIKREKAVDRFYKRNTSPKKKMENKLNLVRKSLINLGPTAAIAIQTHYKARDAYRSVKKERLGDYNKASSLAGREIDKGLQAIDLVSGISRSVNRGIDDYQLSKKRGKKDAVKRGIETAGRRFTGEVARSATEYYGRKAASPLMRKALISAYPFTKYIPEKSRSMAVSLGTFALGHVIIRPATESIPNAIEKGINTYGNRRQEGGSRKDALKSATRMAGVEMIGKERAKNIHEIRKNMKKRIYFKASI